MAQNLPGPLSEAFERAREAVAAATDSLRQSNDLNAVSRIAEASARLMRAERRLAAVTRHTGAFPLAVGPLDKPEDRPPMGEGPRRRKNVNGTARHA